MTKLHSVPPAPEKPAPRKRPQARRKVAPKPTTSIVAQVRSALEPSNRLATLLGALGGAFVPLATYWIAHRLMTSWTSPLVGLVAGGLLYSAPTVYQWARMAFGTWYKALGFVVLLEGVMTFTHGWLAITALGYLIAINAIAAGAEIAVGAPLDVSSRGSSERNMQ
jgi:hypothetical protein